MFFMESVREGGVEGGGRGEGELSLCEWVDGWWVVGGNPSHTPPQRAPPPLPSLSASLSPCLKMPRVWSVCAFFLAVLATPMSIARSQEPYVGMDASGALVLNSTAGRGVMLNGVDVGALAGSLSDARASLSAGRASLASTMDDLARLKISMQSVLRTRLCCFGGIGVDTLSFSECFNGTAWTPFANLSSPRWSHDAVVFQNLVYVVGGIMGSFTSSVEFLSGSTTFVRAPDMPKVRSDSLSIVFNNRLFVIGGRSHPPSPLDEVISFDGFSWTASTSLPASRFGMGGGVYNGLIFACGGAATQTFSSVWSFDGVSTSWSTAPNMIVPRTHAASTVFEGYLYMIGGTSGSDLLSSVERFNGVSWALAGSLSATRNGASAAAYQGRIHVVGGYTTGNSYLPFPEVFDGKNWTVSPYPLLSSRCDFGMVVL